ncbi:flavin reductase family protein [Nocardioides daeguensis]|nr:flavin reductase family protein [Nocardioides daeguensis]MCR1774460.1 flavin reductase family protein [Nocardioides daeguensis]
MSPDARETWPHPELIQSWLGDAEVDFELRPGEEVAVHDDPEAQAAARRFRDTLGCFASGITVITTMSGDEPVGMTCQSFASVSLDPPLITFIPARSSRAWPAIQRSGRFCVNVLAADQEHVSGQMATKGIDKFAGIDWTPARATGSPVLAGALAHLDCTIHAVYEGGDHFIVVGKVEHLEAHPEDAAVAEPLLYFKGRYRTTDA